MPRPAIFGHALEGNLHFLLSQGFDDQRRKSTAMPASWKRWPNWSRINMKDQLPGRTRHRAQHGALCRTRMGRAGLCADAADQGVVGPANLSLNPGVLLNNNGANPPQESRAHAGGFAAAGVHLHRMRLLRAAMPVAWPDLLAPPAHRRREGDGKADLRGRGFAATGGVQEGLCLCRRRSSCAGCSLCSTVCPLDIDTGVFIRELRAQKTGPVSKKIGGAIAPHFAATLTATRIRLARRRCRA